MTRSPIPIAIRTLAAVAMLILAQSALAADQAERPTISTDQLGTVSSGQATEPAAVFGPPPTLAERWRAGLDEATERRDADIAALQAAFASATGEERLAIERQMQARKLDYEIEVLELQLSLDDEREPTGEPMHAAARQRVVDTVEAAREMRASLGVSDQRARSNTDGAKPRSQEAK